MTTKLIINCSTGERTELELTAEEIAQQEADALAFAEQEAAQQVELDAKAETKATAVTKLKALGLTDAEIEALGR